MKGTRSSHRYSKSLITEAVEHGVLEKVHADILLIKHTIHANRDLAAMLRSPVIKTEKKKKILNAIFESNLTPLTSRFLQLICEERREEFLEIIADDFVKKYKENKKILTAVITTASGLDEETRKSVKDLIKKQLQSEIELIEKVNKNLIGGFVLRVGDKQNDASILGKIRLLERTFKENTTLN
jgi:F-type H+-transporting ATPase subunit delta